MITSIRLINWRSHSDTKLEFRKGTNLLVGIMGAGKSSILEGISFALFGTFPALERRKLKLENVIRLNEAAAKAILEFEWEGAAYKIERAIERGKKGVSTHAEIYRGDSVVENGPIAVTAYVKTLTGVDYDLFTRAIYSEQNNIDYFLTLGPGERKEEMDTLLGLDKFELARSNIVTVIHRIRTVKEALSERYSREKLSELEARDKRVAGEMGAAEIQLRELALASERQGAESAVLSAKLETLGKARELYERFTREEIRLSARADSLREEIRGKKVDEAILQELEKRLQKLNEDRSKLAFELKSIENKASAISKEAGMIDARLKAASDASLALSQSKIELQTLLSGMDPAEISRKQKEAEQKVVSIESEKKSLEREISDLGASLERLRPGLSECPLCFSRLTDEGIAHVKKEKDGLVRSKKERIAGLMPAISAARKESERLLAILGKYSLLSERMLRLEEEAKSAPPLHERKKQFELELIGISEGRKSLQIRTDSLSNDVENLRMELNESRQHMLKIKEASSIAARLAEVRSEIKSIQFDEKIYEETRAAAEKARIEFERISSSRKTMETQIKMSAEVLGMVRAELATLRQAEKGIAERTAMEEQLSIYKNALLETQTALRLSLADAINTAMNEIWSIFYPYKNYRALRLGVSEKDYVFEVDDGSGWKGLETMASGGERASAALALRVALAMVLTPKLSWLILDEPTHNLDLEAVELLSSALQFKVPEVVNQTFVITHDEAFMGSDFAASYRLVRDKDRNGETKVEAA
jgi:exonuclease SbcC